MPPPNKKAKHLRDARTNALIHKQNQTTSKRTKERRGYAWAAMSDILKENSDIMMNKSPGPDPGGKKCRPPSTLP